MSEPMFLTLNEVVERYRGRDGTLRNWRSMRIRPSFLILGKTVRYRLGSSIAGIAEISSSVGPSEHP